MPTPTLWNLVSARYDDRVGTTLNPFPQIAFDPLSNSAGFVWNEVRAFYRAALFDAENSWATVEQQQHPSGFGRYYPNPANDYSIFHFDLSKAQQVLLEVYDIAGNEICAIKNENLEAGSHQLRLDVSLFPAGYYTCVLKTEDGEFSDKLVVVH